MAQLARHRLDHDFLGVEHAVDDDAEGLAADLGDHDVAGSGVAAVVDAEQFGQPRQRHQLVAQAQHRRAVDAFDAVVAAAARAHQFDHRHLRDGEAVAAGLDDQRGDDRQRQRDLDGEAQALAGHRLDVDGAADLIDIGADDVHADAAAGYGGDLRRRWKSPG